MEITSLDIANLIEVAKTPDLYELLDDKTNGMIRIVIKKYAESKAELFFARYTAFDDYDKYLKFCENLDELNSKKF